MHSLVQEHSPDAVKHEKKKASFEFQTADICVCNLGCQQASGTIGILQAGGTIGLQQANGTIGILHASGTAGIQLASGTIGILHASATIGSQQVPCICFVFSVE